MEFKVITRGNPLEVWASGFYNDHGKTKAEKMAAEGYWHRHMYEADKHKVLEIVPVERTTR